MDGGRKMKTVKYKDIEVYYTDDLEGGGQLFGQQYIPVIESLFGKVDTIYEICAGPAFIGFSLLAHGLCNKLILSDINTDALEAIQKTIKENKLQKKVEVYWSNGLNNMTTDIKFDLVIANPPHFNNNKLGLVGSDLNWEFHKEFYSNIYRYLKPDGSVLFQENYLGSTEDDFKPMLRNLKYIGSFRYGTERLNTFYFMWSRNIPDNLIWDKPMKFSKLAKDVLMIPRVVKYNIKGKKQEMMQELRHYK